MDHILYAVVLVACMAVGAIVGYVCGYERCRGQYRKIIQQIMAKRGRTHETKNH